MDDKKRRKLIIDLIFEENFDPDYSPDNQSWFVEKLIRGLEDETPKLSDSDIEQKAREVIKKANTLVKANRDFSLALSANGNTRYTKRALESFRKHRVEILYGAIAFNRQFVEPQNLAYLLFIAKRRLRSICRMYFWVNPNYQGYFRYDHTCKANQHWRVNDQAVNFWEELTPAWYSNYSPWKLKTTGVADPVKAIETLFTKKTDPCKGNLFDCETTTSIILMDSLREAKNEAQFTQKLASTGSEYLLIHGFNTDGHTTNFMADTSNNGLMQVSFDAHDHKNVPKVAIPARDLQVGDQCYIFNHPLYKTFRPTGSWTGEYSLVYVTGNRDYRSKKGFTFGGHGKEGTLYKFYDDFLTTLQSELAAACQLMMAHLAFMRGGAAAIVPGTVSEEEHDISIGGAAAVPYRLLEYDKDVAAKDFTKIPTKTKKKPKKGTSAFVVVQSKTEHVFFLEQIDRQDEKKPLITNLKKTIADIVPPGSLKLPIKFRRDEPPPSGATLNEIYALDKWGVAYVDKSTGDEKVWDLFVIADGMLKRHELTHDDLFDSPFALYDPDKTDLEVRQPKVDFGAAHQAFLTANGAF
jgi:hypothetical protein